MDDKDPEDINEHFCYENDLYLSAELGKMLLERTRELEINLKQSHHINEEKKLHIKFLEKECQSLRETKAKELGQMDCILEDLEKSNEILKKENKTYICKVNRLMEVVELLQKKIEEHTKETEIREQGSTVKLYKETSKGISATSYLAETPKNHSNDINKDTVSHGNEVELQEIKKLRSKLLISENKRENLELETSALIDKNEILQELTNSLETRIVNQPECKMFSNKKTDISFICSMCKTNFPTVVRKQESNIKCEYKDDINQVAHLPDKMVVSGKQTHNLSIFGELDSEYQKLIKKYDELLLYCNKALNCSTNDHREEVFGSINLEKSSPSYRQLFNEIFQLIRKQHKI